MSPNKEKTYFINIISKELKRNKENIQLQWNNPSGTSTRNFVLDNFLPKKDIAKIYKLFPKNEKDFFMRKTLFKESKSTSPYLEDFDSFISNFIHALQDKEIVKVIGDILELKKIMPDLQLYGGGPSVLFKNDFINPHIDNSHDIKRKHYRRLNLLFYLSPNWSLINGGNFELWDKKLEKPKTFVSQQNRLIVMETTKDSWHSVSKVKTNKPRCAISVYYFSALSPSKKNYFHVTSFTGRPNQYLLRLYSKFDNKLRNFLSEYLNLKSRQKINDKR